MVRQYFESNFSGKRVGLLGFGREGISTYKTFREFVPSCKLVILDRNPDLEQRFRQEFGKLHTVELYGGSEYASHLTGCDVVFKSPGVSPLSLQRDGVASGIDFQSQTGVFTRLFRNQIIGVTGTKGKSTTVSLLYHIFRTAGRDALLAGNIGIPPFQLLNQVKPDTTIVYEMSSHQLEGMTVSPGISVLLNIFQEHLDHYSGYREYQLAKMNIARWQQPGDIFIYNSTNNVVQSLVHELHPGGIHYAINGISEQGNGVSCRNNDLHITRGQKETIINGLCAERKLKGAHNLINIAAAALAASLKGIEEESIRKAVATFEGLPHRLEFVREWKGVKYFNDSISTIPESTIEAIKTFPAVQTLLLGGFDRGVDYSILTDYLAEHPVPVIVFIGKAGERMLKAYQAREKGSSAQVFWYNSFEDAVRKAAEMSREGGVCLLSPAAASYDMFSNFEERGEKFRQIIQELTG